MFQSIIVHLSVGSDVNYRITKDHEETLKCNSSTTFRVILLNSATINHSDTVITTSEYLSCPSVQYNFSDSL